MYVILTATFSKFAPLEQKKLPQKVVFIYTE